MGITESLGRKQVGLRAKTRFGLVASQLASTGLGLGYLPWAPGTWASLVTAAFWYVLYQFAGSGAWLFHLLAVIVLFPVSWLSSAVYSTHLSRKDPSIIVIDEIVGQSLCLLFVVPTAAYFVAGLLLFRFIDIVKPPPVRQAERLRGGLGITLDDCTAGIYAGSILWLFHAG